uniref:Guanine nucleotide-binding protein-like 1 n=1 Tax=Corethrella appendiculata TaxID=1370023 RepID=U5ENI0_9DIPT
MPQGRRKVPFSGKQKKQQLLLKKQSKAPQSINLIRNVKGEDDSTSDINDDSDYPKSIVDNVQKINIQPCKDPRSKSNRYVLQFHRETSKELKEMKAAASKSLQYVCDKDMEIGDNYFNGYDFPKRPEWTFQMSKEQLDANENRYFFKYITNLEKTHYDDMKSLSYCELNLETWRQLWRVLELSDIVLIIVDIRFPTLMFPPDLYDYVTNKLEKSMILVLNKIDIVPAEHVIAWKKYFEAKYPTLKVVLFTSYPSYNLRGKQENKTGLKIRRRRGRMRMAAEGATQILNACKEIVDGAVDLSSWEEKIAEEKAANESASNNDYEDDGQIVSERTHEEEKDFDFEQHVKYRNGIATIGFVGFPNVGKSSLLNAIFGKKVVSVSRTPGHTKHFQTIFLTNSVRLCDCPGLVFPSSCPRKLQVLLGSYPIAQLREPYASIKYLAERVNLPKILGIQHPIAGETEWSAIDICDGWAIKRGFFTAKAARADTYRAANSILRMALDGKVSLALAPSGFYAHREEWRNHAEIEFVKSVQALSKPIEKSEDEENFSDTDTDEPAAQGAESESDENRNSIDDKRKPTKKVPDSPAATVSNPFDLLGSPE